MPVLEYLALFNFANRPFDTYQIQFIDILGSSLNLILKK